MHSALVFQGSYCTMSYLVGNISSLRDHLLPPATDRPPPHLYFLMSLQVLDVSLEANEWYLVLHKSTLTQLRTWYRCKAKRIQLFRETYLHLVQLYVRYISIYMYFV